MREQANCHSAIDRLPCREATIVQEIDPLNDPPWPAFVDGHPSASVFHTRGWLEAVYRTYGHEPAAITTGVRSELTNAFIFCRLHSRLTGRRIVSFPSSDHREPLADGNDEVLTLFTALKELAASDPCHYVEVRPTSASPGIAAN